MPTKTIETKMNERHFAIAITLSLHMWSDNRYLPFLMNEKPVLDSDWFKWFIREWSVARTIQANNHDLIRHHLDKDFRKALNKGEFAKAVDNSAEHIQEKKWSAKSGKKRFNCLPISLVSKIGFLLRPDELVPRDSFSLKGLNILQKNTGEPSFKESTYQEYLAAFNKQFDMYQPQIDAAINKEWVRILSRIMGCPSGMIGTRAHKRKVMDNYLMLIGGYLGQAAA